MPLTLLHGPAGSEKSEKLRQIWAENHQNKISNFFWIIPHHQCQDSVERKLLDKTNHPGFLTQDSIGTLKQFLIKLLKLNFKRIHEAPLSVSRHIIRKKLYSEKYSQFKSDLNFSGLVHQIALSLISLKQNGLDAKKSKQLFSRFQNPKCDEFLNLFEDYQEELEKIHFFDDGDFVLKTLDLIEKNELILPQLLTHIYIDRLNLLTFGERQLITQLAKKYSHLKIYLNYSFDHTQKDDAFFYPTYSFLGENCDEEIFFPNNNVPQIKACVLTDPFSEINYVAQEIKKDLNSGLNSEDIAIVIPNQVYYQNQIFQLLEKNRIPCFINKPVFFKTHTQLDKHDFAELSHTYSQDFQKPIARQLLASFIQTQFENQWQFEENLLLKDIDSKIKSVWKKEEEHFFSFKPPHISGGVFCSDLENVSCLDFKKTYVIGFTDNLYPQINGDHPFYTEEMLQQPELREILKGPSYQFEVVKNFLNQILSRSTHLIFTRPQTFWENREQTNSRLLDLNWEPVFFENNFKPINKQNKKFPALKKKRFGITELQTYLNCPYQYYLRHHLKIEDRDDDNTEVPHDIRGLMVHEVLDQFYKNEKGLYLDALEFEIYRDRIKDKIIEITQKVAEKNKGFKHVIKAVQKDFIERAALVINQLIQREIIAIKEDKKLTHPWYFEWAFGKGSTPPLKLSTEYGDVFIGGRIDRIDVTQGTQHFTVIDYKTGQIDSGKKIKEGHSLQIPLYMMAVHEILLKDYQPSAGLLIGLKELKEQKGLIIKNTPDENYLSKTYQITKDEWLHLKQVITKKIGDVAKQINEGEFNPKPDEDSHCLKCEFRKICDYAR